MRHGDDFPGLGITDAKLENDMFSFLEERLHRWGLAARCASLRQFSKD
jgi:hypothetical protein